jgi:hypothetical protein
VGRASKLFFGVKARPTAGPWQYLYPPGLLFASRGQTDDGENSVTVRPYLLGAAAPLHTHRVCTAESLHRSWVHTRTIRLQEGLLLRFSAKDPLNSAFLDTGGGCIVYCPASHPPRSETPTCGTTGCTGSTGTREGSNTPHSTSPPA